MRKTGLRRTMMLATTLAALSLAGSAPDAPAANGGVGPPSGNQGDKPNKADGSGKDTKKGSGGGGRASGASLRRLRTIPRKAFLGARRPARFQFALRGTKRRNLIVTVVRSVDAAPVRSWELRRVKPGAEPTVRWAGISSDGLPVAQGAYDFVVTNANGTPADTSKAEGQSAVNFYGHKFPVRGDYTFGDGLGAGRNHQGFDIAAACGTPIVAARGGVVKWRKFQRGGAGHYVVIDGWRTGLDYVYMHLRERSIHAKGDRVRTGQLLGYMGSTGRSTGCHLHFEVWSAPGWGAGGEFLDAERMVRRWARWS